MYSIRKEKEIVPNIMMMERIIAKLNEKFDPTESYHHSDANSEMFEFQMKIDDHKREAWQIVFMGIHTVASGSFFGYDYSDCQEEEYITLEEKNELKIFMLAVNGTINYIEKFINYVALSDASLQNKQKWIGMLKKSIED